MTHIPFDGLVNLDHEILLTYIDVLKRMQQQAKARRH